MAVAEHTLMLICGIIAPLGLVLVLVGWYGAARTPNLFEQVPYMISGGILGRIGAARSIEAITVLRRLRASWVSG